MNYLFSLVNVLSGDVLKDLLFVVIERIINDKNIGITNDDLIKINEELIKSKHNSFDRKIISSFEEMIK